MLKFSQKNRLRKRFKRKSFHKPTWDIVWLYEKFTGNTLKRSGKAWKGKCPFIDKHQDSNPSFAIYPDTQSYYCFGCFESGTSSWFKKRMAEIYGVNKLL